MGISNELLSDGKYQVRSGDTLNGLAQDLKQDFPVLREMYNLEDRLFQENPHAFGGSRDQLFAGSELNLPFIFEAIERHKKPDTYAQEYIFINDDKLAFRIDERRYWDALEAALREQGKSLRESFNNMGGRSLPDRLPLFAPRSLPNSSTDFWKKFYFPWNLTMEEIGAKVAEESKGVLDKTTVAEKLASANRVALKTGIPAEDICKLDASCIIEMCQNALLTGSQQGNLERGFWGFDEGDRILLDNDPSGGELMQRITRTLSSNSSLIREAREAVGYPVDRLHEEEIQRGRAFIPTARGLGQIRWEYSSLSNPVQDLSSEAQKRAKVAALFANSLGATITKLVCTSTKRTAERQAEIIRDNILRHYNGSDATYRRVRGILKKEIDHYHAYKSTATQQEKNKFSILVYNTSLNDINDHKDLYLHVAGAQDSVFDIGPKESFLSSTDVAHMNSAIQKMQSSGYVRPSSLYYLEKRGEDGYHFVID